MLFYWFMHSDGHLSWMGLWFSKDRMCLVEYILLCMLGQGYASMSRERS